MAQCNVGDEPRCGREARPGFKMCEYHATKQRARGARHRGSKPRGHVDPRVAAQFKDPALLPKRPPGAGK